MKKLLGSAIFVSLAFIGGCSGDNSGDTRQVSTPNPPVLSPTAPTIANNPKIPDETKKTLSHVIPPGGATQQAGG